MNKKLKVLIVGAGLGGLVLANSIKKHGDPEKIEFEVFERDPSSSARSQGYIIGLTPVGIDAIKHSVSDDQFERIKQLFKPGQFTVADRNINILLGLNTSNTINRVLLRNILMEGINVSFGKRLQSYQESEDSVNVQFEDGTSVTGDILVGADGVRSSVRGIKLPDFKFADVNVFRIQALVSNPSKDIVDFIFPDENRTIIKTLGNKRNTIIFGRTTNIQGAISLGIEDLEDIDDLESKNQSTSELILISYEWRPAPKESKKLPETKEEMLQLIRRDTASYHPLVRKLLCEQLNTEHFIDPRPVPLTQAAPLPNFKTSRVTLLGDAVHAMTSHAGQGGNMAMKDGQELGNFLIEISNGSDLIQTITKYETQMITRGFKAVDMSRSNTERMHASEVGPVGEGIRNFFMKFFFKLIVWGIVKLPE